MSQIVRRPAASSDIFVSTDYQGYPTFSLSVNRQIFCRCRNYVPQADFTEDELNRTINLFHRLPSSSQLQSTLWERWIAFRTSLLGKKLQYDKMITNKSYIRHKKFRTVQTWTPILQESMVQISSLNSFKGPYFSCRRG